MGPGGGRKQPGRIAKSAPSEKLRERFGLRPRPQRVRYREPAGEGLWDGARPGFTEATEIHFYETNLQKRRDRRNARYLYPCEKCDKWFPRGRDQRPGDAYIITIQHRTDWTTAIYKWAEVDEAGKPTKEGATNAYNRLSNLELWCSGCNSSASGPKDYDH